MGTRRPRAGAGVELPPHELRGGAAPAPVWDTLTAARAAGMAAPAPAAPPFRSPGPPPEPPSAPPLRLLDGGPLPSEGQYVSVQSLAPYVIGLLRGFYMAIFGAVGGLLTGLQMGSRSTEDLLWGMLIGACLGFLGRAGEAVIIDQPRAAKAEPHESVETAAVRNS